MKRKNILQPVRQTMRRPMMPPALCILALLMATCTQDELADGTGNALPEGKYPMTFSTAVEGLTVTRANTAEGEWTTGDEVAVKVESVVKKYKPTTTGASTTLTCDDAANPFYWQKTTETVSAWCDGTGAYNGTQPTTWTVQTNQSGDGYQKSDFIYAKPQTFTYSNGTSSQLTFNHLPAKVIINLKAGDGITGQEVQNATVTLINQATTSGAIGEDGTVEQVSTGSETITPNLLGTAATGYQQSVQALVVPQQMQNTQFIQVTLGGTYHYYYTPKGENDANLVSGQQYTYNLTVKNGYLEVAKATSGAWGGGDTEAVVSDITYTPSDLKIGDYYYSDGTTSDGGLRKLYANGTTECEDIDPDPNKTCIGIVYSTDVERIGAAAKKVLEEKKVTPHGLVMALTDASDGCQWGANNDENSGGNDGEPFKDNTNQLAKQYKNVNGYAETQWIINTYGKNGNSALKDTYTAFYHASLYGTAESNTEKYAAPDKTTGWFIPSMGQWWDILSNLGGINLDSYKTVTDTDFQKISNAAPTAISNMNTYLNKISGATQFGSDTYFWSSSECKDTHACNVVFHKSSSLDLYNFNKPDKVRVRCSLAF